MPLPGPVTVPQGTSGCAPGGKAALLQGPPPLVVRAVPVSLPRPSAPLCSSRAVALTPGGWRSAQQRDRLKWLLWVRPRDRDRGPGDLCVLWGAPDVCTRTRQASLPTFPLPPPGAWMGWGSGREGDGGQAPPPVAHVSRRQQLC